MDTNAGHNVATFKQKELSGWDAKAQAYDDYAGKITTQLVGPLLDAARVGTKTRLLGVACGPGYVAGAAAERGANAVGMDFAPSMVVEAKKNFPRAEFFEGDAEALQFEAILTSALTFKRKEGFRIGWPAIIAAATKP